MTGVTEAGSRCALTRGAKTTGRSWAGVVVGSGEHRAGDCGRGTATGPRITDCACTSAGDCCVDCSASFGN
jgi:hypothetical protein